MKKNLILICLFFSGVIGNASAQVFQWAKAQPKAIYSTQLAVEKNLIATIGGFKDSISIGNQTLIARDTNNIYVAAHNQNGQFKWAQKISFWPTRSINISTFNILIDQGKNVIISGIFFDSMTVNLITHRKDLNHGAALFLVKFDSLGVFQWAQSASLIASFPMGPPKIANDGAGNIYLTAPYTGTLKIGNDSISSLIGRQIFLAKFHPTGTITWIKNADFNTKFDWPVIKATASGAIFLGATTSAPPNSLNGIDGIELARYDAAGFLQWKATAEGLHPPAQILLGIDQTGNAYLTGEITDSISFVNPGNGSFNLLTYNPALFMAKINVAGRWVWAKNLFTGNYNPYWHRFSLSPANKLIISGIYQDSIKISNTSFTTLNPNSSESYFASFDTTGTLSWAFSKKVSNTDIAGDEFGNFYFAGQFNGQTSFGNTVLTTNAIWGAAYLAKMTSFNNPAGLSSKSSAEFDFQLFPNPATDEVIISANFKSNSTGTLKLVSLLGQTISENTFFSSSQICFRLPLTNLAKGVYLVQIATPTHLQTRRLVVR